MLLENSVDCRNFVQKFVDFIAYSYLVLIQFLYDYVRASDGYSSICLVICRFGCICCYLQFSTLVPFTLT